MTALLTIILFICALVCVGLCDKNALHFGLLKPPSQKVDSLLICWHYFDKVNVLLSTLKYNLACI
jgi:hypothetical protein